MFDSAIYLIFAIVVLLFIWILFALVRIQNKREFFSISSISFGLSCLFVFLVLAYISEYLPSDSELFSKLSGYFSGLAERCDKVGLSIFVSLTTMLMLLPIVYSVLCRIMAKFLFKKTDASFFNIDRYVKLLAVIMWIELNSRVEDIFPEHITKSTSHVWLMLLLPIVISFVFCYIIYRPIVRQIVTFGQKIEPGTNEKSAQDKSQQIEAAAS